VECKHEDTYFEHQNITSIDDQEVFIMGNLVCEYCGEIVASCDIRQYTRI